MHTMSSSIKDNKESELGEAFSPEQQKVIMQHLMITKQLNINVKNYSHVPCKFFKSGKCQAGEHCKFSHQSNILNSANLIPCKYYKKGHCKFGEHCVNSHELTSPSLEQTINTQTNSNDRSRSKLEVADDDSIDSISMLAANNNLLSLRNGGVHLGSSYEESARNINSTFASSIPSSSTNSFAPYNYNRAGFATPISSVSSSSNSWQKSAIMENNRYPQMTPTSSTYASTRPNTPSNYSNYHLERYSRRYSNNNGNFGYQIKEEEGSMQPMEPNYSVFPPYSQQYGYPPQFDHGKNGISNDMPLMMQMQQSNFHKNYSNVPLSPTSQYPMSANDFTFENHSIQLEDTLFFFDDF
ncbi:hypothetical protein TPHA_0C01630 [Tetrapisispora phaffii CBS 4417]|uniref:C3H1-type domain-containing protein n=1 Tax=Tetrapisispora phaffii (strain ATCC 24235 / CBS 4417 / NBRC 1672 / NRRL Y-8282 / UCD 70-5) TaxID=1071381 RepID=G8BRE3_TETPH|nr:hypothetical protein TPHA_0C01630 [Tetrapisispora phaffii CBS 4417]CCE62319.1 hypothetical protein TPHA_0C01630 [Tetrapisispora phaffii CBS 4417]